MFEKLPKCGAVLNDDETTWFLDRIAVVIKNEA
jgi:hypothetical protein